MAYERNLISKIDGYVPGEQPDELDTIKLNTNENPYPPAPSVGEALRAFDVSLLRRYPQPTALDFRTVAGALHGVDPDSVLATNGGDELLRLAITTFVDPGEAIAVAVPSYSLYPVLAGIHGAHIAEIPLGDLWHLPKDFVAHAHAARANLALIVNPHAPSGHLLSVDVLAKVAGDFKGVLLVDEAYVDFIDEPDAHRSIELTKSFDNVLILRTMSKGYSLAGLRYGYGLGAPSLIAPMQHKTKDSYNTNALSQLIATSALQAQDYARETWCKVRGQRQRMIGALGQLGLACNPSQANFLLTQVPPDWHPGGAAAVYQGLKARRILVRHFNDPRLVDSLRITIGTEAENDALLAALSQLRGKPIE